MQRNLAACVRVHLLQRILVLVHLLETRTQSEIYSNSAKSPSLPLTQECFMAETSASKMAGLIPLDHADLGIPVALQAQLYNKYSSCHQKNLPKTI